MFTKTLEINKRMTYREIFHKINNSSNKLDMMIGNVVINDNTINFDLTSSLNEISITLILSGDVGLFPKIEKTIISLEKGDITIINKIKETWVD